MQIRCAYIDQIVIIESIIQVIKMNADFDASKTNIKIIKEKSSIRKVLLAKAVS